MKPILLPLTEVEVGGVALRIIPPRPEQPFYEYQIEALDGRPRVTAKLTYDLLRNTPDRTLLRVDSKFASQIWPIRDLVAFRELYRRVQAKQAERLGNISIAKGIVLDLNEDEAPPENLTVTVHRFGAVPVALLSGSAEIPLGDTRKLETRLGVYASLPRPRGGTVLSAKADLLRSCRIKLDILFRSYLEEIAAEFHDIKNHASRVETFERLKRVEETLAASIKTKLEPVLMHAPITKRTRTPLLGPASMGQIQSSDNWGGARARVRSLHD